MNEIDAIVPVNEAHRKRLERLKANLEKLHARQAQESAALRIETEMTQERVANTRELAQLRIALNQEIRDALFENAEEQAALLRRIAEKTRTLSRD